MFRPLRRWRVLSPWLLAGVAGCASEPAAPPTPAAEVAPKRDPVKEHALECDKAFAWLCERYDLDHDGRITRAEYPRGDASFARLDRDGDGAITRADFDREITLPPDLVVPMLLVRMCGARDAESVSLAEIRGRFGQLDFNGDGRIDRAEFERFAGSAGASWIGLDRFGTLLAAIDQDHDGLISAPEIERYFRERDKDGDGFLSRRERDVGGPPLSIGWIEPDAREPAPDFTATPLEGGAPVALSTYFDRRPVALLFGSFT